MGVPPRQRLFPQPLPQRHRIELTPRHPVSEADPVVVK